MLPVLDKNTYILIDRHYPLSASDRLPGLCFELKYESREGRSPLDNTASLFSRWMLSYTSLRYTFTFLGARIPNLTWSPLMSTTDISMESPIMILSLDRLDSINMP